MLNNKQARAKIEELIENGYTETETGYHAEYRMWNGNEQRGCYAQIAAPYGGTKRIYNRSWSELLIDVLEYIDSLNS